jgi:hypothetical protein
MSSPENPRLENQSENAAVSEKDTSAAGPATSMPAVDADLISKGGCRLGWQTMIEAFIRAGEYSDSQGLRIALEEGLGAPSVVPKTMSLAELSDDGGFPAPTWKLNSRKCQGLISLDTDSESFLCD